MKRLAWFILWNPVQIWVKVQTEHRVWISHNTGCRILRVHDVKYNTGCRILILQMWNIHNSGCRILIEDVESSQYRLWKPCSTVCEILWVQGVEDSQKGVWNRFSRGCRTLTESGGQRTLPLGHRLDVLECKTVQGEKFLNHKVWFYRM